MQNFKKMDSHASKIEPGSQGLIYLPFLAGPGTLDVAESVRGVFYGAEMHHTQHHFTRAVLEAIGFTGKYMLRQMALPKDTILDIRSLGGGARSPIWNQIRSEIIGMPITTMQCSESASLGIAMLEACALGYYTHISEAVSEMAKEDRRYTPRETKTQQYEEAYNKFQYLLHLFSEKEK